MRLGAPPAGYGSWTLKLLQNEMISIEQLQQAEISLQKLDALISTVKNPSSTPDVDTE